MWQNTVIPHNFRQADGTVHASRLEKPQHHGTEVAPEDMLQDYQPRNVTKYNTQTFQNGGKRSTLISAARGTTGHSKRKQQSWHHDMQTQQRHLRTVHNINSRRRPTSDIIYTISPKIHLTTARDAPAEQKQPGGRSPRQPGGTCACIFFVVLHTIIHETYRIPHIKH